MPRVSQKQQSTVDSQYVSSQKQQSTVDSQIKPKYNIDCIKEIAKKLPPPTDYIPSQEPIVILQWVLTQIETLESNQSTVGDKHFTFIQNIATDIWVIIHNLNKFPSVQVQDSAGTDIVGEITYESLDKITIHFSSAFSGRAYLN